MAYNTRTPVTAIEFGSDKICVLHGARDENGNAEVLAFAQASSENSVRKGTILDFEKAMRIFSEVLDRADRSLPSASDRRNVYCLLNGPPVSSRRGEGTVMVYTEKVERRHVREALEKAHALALPRGVLSFNSYDGFFVINRSNRVKDPTGRVAEQLDAYVHILTVERQYLENVRRLFREQGFDRGAEPVFSGIASAFGVLRTAEREEGVLLVDMGLEVCDYVLICAEGVYLSGVLPVGVANVANDLAVALELPYDFCIKFLRESRMTKLREAGTNFLEHTASVTGKKRRIPLDSFEKIIDLRLRETFSIILNKVNEKNLASCMSSGIVLTGGGSLLEGAVENMKSVSGAPVRIGEPFGVSGVKAGFEAPPPCYAALLGLLKYALEEETLQKPDGIGYVRDALSGVAESVLRKIRSFGKVFGK